MSAVDTLTRTAPRSVSPGIGVTFPRLVRSEWIKLWTVRSTLWVLPVTVAAQVGFAALAAWAFASIRDAGEELGVTTADLLGNSIQISQMTISVLAVLTLTGEYRTGMIRTTLSADPRRLPSLAAKLLVMLGTAFVVTVVSTALAWAVTTPWLGDAPLDLGDGGQRLQLVGAPLYVTAVCLLAYALGALLRHSAGALAAVFGLLMVLPSLFGSIPAAFFQNVSPYLPTSAGSQILYAADAQDVLSPWQGYGVLVAWGVVILAVAAVLLRRRDA